MPRIRRVTDLPIAVGFGVRTPEQAAAIARVADGVVVGSALVKIVAEHGTNEETAALVAEKVRELRAAMAVHLSAQSADSKA